MGWLVVSASAEAAECPNEAFRFGLSVDLPDCRTYELVTPPEMDGRVPEAISTMGTESPGDLFPTQLASNSGESIVYMTNASPLTTPPEATGKWDLYRAERSGTGWATDRRLTPNGAQSLFSLLGGVSADNAYAFVDPEGYKVLGSPAGILAQAGKSSYLSKPGGSFELTGRGSLGSEPYAQGRYISIGGKHVVFTTGHSPMQSQWCPVPSAECKVVKLEEKAPPEGTGAVYDREADGPTHVVSLLPGDKTPNAGEDAFYQGVSKDASSVAFKINGTLYVRAHNGEVEQRTEVVAAGNPTYAGLSDNGKYLFYVLGGNRGTIHRFDTATEADVSINPTAEGEVVNVSADGSHVYFISEEEIGGEGQAGKPNLFVWRESDISPAYVATVAPSDLVRTSGEGNAVPALTRWTSYAVVPQPGPELAGDRGPGADSSRTTPDGTVLVFESRAKLTDYDNANPAACPSWTTAANEIQNPEGRCTEIYRYDDRSGMIKCVSCHDSAIPSAGARLQDLKLVTAPIVLHNLSDDGNRVFFETDEALVARDTDEVNDIYEWHEGSGGGEVGDLISSGQSVDYAGLGMGGERLLRPNRLLSIPSDGGDVFFLSQDALVAGAGAGGAPAIYDARVGGGFEAPEAPTVCGEEACHRSSSSSSSAPPLGAPASEVRSSAGNVKVHRHHRKRRCRSRRHQKRHPCPKKTNKGKKEALAARAVTLGQQLPLTPSAGPGVEGSPESGASEAGSSPISSAAGEFEEFGIESVGASLSDTAAAAHTDFKTLLTLNHFVDKVSGLPGAKSNVEDIIVSLPPGLLGSVNAVPTCSTGALIDATKDGGCPIATQVGIVALTVYGFSQRFREPLFNMEPVHPDREVARLGFFAHSYPVFINVHVRTAGDYGVTATVEDAPAVEPLLEAETVLWGNPADSSHDKLRLTSYEALFCDTACQAGGERKSPIPPEERQAFMTNPSACQGGEVSFKVTSYQLPGQIFTASASLDPITDCNGLPFAPAVEAEPTSHVAGAPTGLKTKVVLPQHLGEGERATATMREARVTLPTGMQVAAGAANWVGTCSDAQVGFHEEVDVNCPDGSKLGTATFKSPDLPEPIEGTIYQRNPRPGHQLGLWLTSDALGLHLKLPGELEPDKNTGRLTAVFKDLPQVPVEEIDLNVWGGPRAPLENPDHCGTFTTDFSFSPHSNDPAASGQSQMRITEGCNQGFNPTLYAGATEPIAGKFSPFVFDLARNDGQQALRGFELKLPDGELAKLRGVPLCSEAEASAGACPEASRIGFLQATTGPGPEPLSLPQPGKPEPQIYLAGPYRGAPFSILSEVPAQAGPFDLGTLAVRSGLTVEPETGRAVVKADPLPQFFEGIGIAYRHLHAVIDRPNFSLNPTDCREMAVNSAVTSTQGTVAHPSARFQVDGCKALKFKPKLFLKLRGGTKRADYPALTAVLKAREGDANIASASVALPHSEFLAQEHIGTICTRKQFAADKCPKASVYGRAKAWTPLLDEPLSGPVYLRSSNHPLPDLVAKLNGQLEIDLVGRIDSVHGGIRTIFGSVPDAPVSRFVLQMKGGGKGLLTNSTDICRGAHRASVAMQAQNARISGFGVPLRSPSCGA